MVALLLYKCKSCGTVQYQGCMRMSDPCCDNENLERTKQIDESQRTFDFGDYDGFPNE